MGNIRKRKELRVGQQEFESTIKRLREAISRFHKGETVQFVYYELRVVDIFLIAIRQYYVIDGIAGTKYLTEFIPVY